MYHVKTQSDPKTHVINLEARCLFNDREKSQETTALKRTYCNRHANISLNYFSNLIGNVPSKQNKKMHFSFVEKFREKRFCVYFCPSS